MSNVPLSRRNQSRVEFEWLAKEIRKTLRHLLIKDFGVKSVSKELKTFTYTAKMERSDRETFLDLCNKYSIDVETQYPMWTIEDFRNELLALSKEGMRSIGLGQAIYPQSVYMFNKRRGHQTDAIGYFALIKGVLKEAGDILPIDYQKFMPLVGKIDREIYLLKQWKQSDNKRLPAIIEKELREKQEVMQKIYKDVKAELLKEARRKL